MLSKENRLAADKDFSRLFAKGRSFQARGFSMRVITNKYGKPRIGFVVSTKVSKRAVVRNLLKRRMREIVRPVLPKIQPRDIDIAFTARPEAAKFEFAAVRDAVISLLEKSGLLRNERQRT